MILCSSYYYIFILVGEEIEVEKCEVIYVRKFLILCGL